MRFKYFIALRGVDVCGVPENSSSPNPNGNLCRVKENFIEHPYKLTMLCISRFRTTEKAATFAIKMSQFSHISVHNATFEHAVYRLLERKLFQNYRSVGLPQLHSSSKIIFATG